MPTSVHIPPKLLASVDRKARALGVSRNRLIITALEREVAERTWAPGFLEGLLDVDRGMAEAVDEMLDHVQTNRRSKGPPKL